VAQWAGIIVRDRAERKRNDSVSCDLDRFESCEPRYQDRNLLEAVENTAGYIGCHIDSCNLVCGIVDVKRNADPKR